MAVNTKTKCCQGITLKGLPCKIKIDSNFNFCFFHKEQLLVKSVTTKCCKAITKSGTPCKKKLNITSTIDYCVFHKSQGLDVIEPKVIRDTRGAAPALKVLPTVISNEGPFNDKKGIVKGFGGPKTLLSTNLDSEPADNSGFIISRPKAMFLGAQDSNTVRINHKKKPKKKSSSDEDSEDIFIIPAGTDTQSDEASDDDIFEYVRKWKESNNPPKKGE